MSREGYAVARDAVENEAPEETAKRICSLPEVPGRELGPEVSPVRAAIIRNLDRKWVNETKLRYYFFEDPPLKGKKREMDMVRDAFQIWTDVGIGIGFEEVDRMEEAEVRISFRKDGRAWSYVGRDVIDVPGPVEPTMNFGWDITRDPRKVDVAVHEIGHTLGFPHEHQNPFAGIEWDESAVIDEFSGPPNNWPDHTIRHNILRKISRSEVTGTEWDPNSIMHYSFAPGLILRPEWAAEDGIDPELGLSEHDVGGVKNFYPPIGEEEKHPLLEPFESMMLDLGPGKQLNVRIEPEVTRDYTIRTFGGSDTVMVLFEDQDGDLKFVAGDDDSGTSLNAEIEVRLFAGRRYVLRIRLYFNWATGQSAVMYF